MTETEFKLKYFVKTSPFLHSGNSVQKIMFYTILALMPSLIVSCYFFGLDALIRYIICIVCAVLFEFVYFKLILKSKKTEYLDGSAILTAILYCMNLPANIDIAIMLVGLFVAIVIAKLIFGGLGFNIFNPALIGRTFLLISFPFAMTTWPALVNNFTGFTNTTCATPLNVLKLYGPSVLFKKYSLFNLFIGAVPGSMGECSAILLILGGLFLIYKKIITWHIPIIYILTVFVLGNMFHYINPDKFIPGIYHIMSGGLMLGAFFMATDFVTSPLTNKGKIIFAFGCGIITFIIRIFGAYPEGVAFSILIMNALTPLIDKLTLTKPFGAVYETTK